jgi:hypothetical protein
MIVRRAKGIQQIAVITSAIASVANNKLIADRMAGFWYTI